MAWNGAFRVVGGLFNGFTPNGTLTGFTELVEGDHGTFGSYGSVDSPPAKEWAGAFGSNGDPMLQYGKRHADEGQQVNIPLFELQFKTPPQSAFEKQTLMVYGTVTCGKSEGTDDDESYLGYNYSFTLTNMTRRYFLNGQWFEESIPTTGSVVIGAGNWVVMSGHNHWDNYYIIDKLYYAFSPFRYNNTDYYGAAIYIEDVSGDGLGMWNGGALLSIEKATIHQYFGVDEPEEKEDPNEEGEDPENGEPGGYSDEDGGDGRHNRPVDPVPIPGPNNDHTAAGAGFITVYAPAPQQMRNFASDMFATTVWEAIKLFLGNPLDFIIGCLSIPYTPTLGDAYYPKFGLVTFEHSMLTVTEQYKQLDFGSIYIEPYGNNCFDFSPYTKIQIWLPYIGYRELNTDEVMGKNVHVKYTCDCVSGSCVAFISTQVKPKGLAPMREVVIAQFEGNCGVQIPVGSVSFDNFIQTSIAGTVNGVVGIAQTVMGGEGNADKAVSQLTSTTVGKITGLKPTVERSGSIASSAGKNSIEYPYIIRTFPQQSLPTNYKDIFGYPSNIGGTLGDGFEGVAIVDEIQLNDIPAMEEERAEIMDWLRKGVLL